MPFKLKLKKSRQYNVSSKNLFVIAVELLDNTIVECTLSAQSTGQECLNNVCQRLSLHQPQYFGLRFLSKRNTLWWLELERPLKKQLDKYAQEGSTLHLGVMYFVADVNMLHDEVTSYSLQAEFGDHDAERHTTEYLTNFGLLPKHVAHGKSHQEAILENVIHTHRSLQGLSLQLAEVYYIREAQSLDGYGQDCFPGKDNSGTALFVCLSLKGIAIRYLNDQHSICFLWEQIVNLVHHKRCFGIECVDNPKVIQIFMEDSHIAKYVWKTCIQQHQFYTKNEDASRCDNTGTQSAATVASAAFNVLKPLAEEETEQDKLKSREWCNRAHLQESQDSLDALGVYHTEGGYSEHLPPTSTSMYDTQEIPSTQEMSPSMILQQPKLLTTSGGTHLTSSTPTLQTSYSHPAGLRISSSAAQLHTSATTDKSFYQMNQPQHSSSKKDLEMETRCPVLPSYRQAPDYDTAVKIKYGIQSISSSDVMSSSPIEPSQSASVRRSQADACHVLPYQQAVPLQSYAQYKNYNDLSHLDVNDINVAGDRNDVMSLRHYENLPVTCLSMSSHTYSSPELASQSTMQDVTPEQLAANMNLMYQFKPPPPYPYMQSSSTPDLTKNHHQHLPIISSPNVASPSDIASTAQYANYPLPQAATGVNPESSNHFHTDLNLQQLQQHHSANSASTTIELNSALAHNGVSGLNPVVHPPVPNLSSHTYLNYNPGMVKTTAGESTACRVTEPAFSTVMTAQSTKISCQLPQEAATVVKPAPAKTAHMLHYEKIAARKPANLALNDDAHSMGPMLVAAMNGLTLSQPDILAASPDEGKFPVDPRIVALETKLIEGQVFLEYEQILKKKSMADFMTALMPENIPRNRFKDVFPYEESRVRLTPTNENKTGYINASHLSVAVGGLQHFYIAAQGPLPNTLYSFWQMIWEHHVSVIVMLTEVQEEGQDKCFPYWPQEDNKTIQIGEFQINRNYSMSSPTYVTCSLSLCYITSNQKRSIWHVQYTDWPDHSCPEDVQGFIRFMGEIDMVRRLSLHQQPQPALSTSPIVVHCSAGVGRSGVVILCDIMLYALDHNQPIDVPKVLTQLRLQRMLTVQTLAQYKFVYVVLIQYLRNSRLI